MEQGGRKDEDKADMMTGQTGKVEAHIRAGVVKPVCPTSLVSYRF